MSRPKIKVTNETIRMRYEMARRDPDFFKEHGRQFGFKDAAKMFGVSEQAFWYYHSQNPKYQALPSKKRCPHCGRSMYDMFSKWINDGAMDELLKKSAAASKEGDKDASSN